MGKVEESIARKKCLNEKINDILENWSEEKIDDLTSYCIGNKENRFYSLQEREFIKTALMHCVAYHNKTTRESGDYYAVHPIETARMMDSVSRDVEARGDVVKIAAALLHDTIEEGADRLNFRIETYNESLAKLLDDTKESLYEFARNFRYYREFERDLQDTTEVIMLITRTPEKDFYGYLDSIYDIDLSKNVSEDIVKKTIQVKHCDRIDNTRDLWVFSDHHRNYSVYKNLHLIHRTRNKFYLAEPKTSDDFAIKILDIGLKEACYEVEEEIIQRIRQHEDVGEDMYNDFVEILLDYIKTPNFRKVTKATTSGMDEIVYTYDGTIYRFNEYLHEKKTIRNDKGVSVEQVLRDSLLMRAINWGYILDPKFRLEGLEDINKNGN